MQWQDTGADPTQIDKVRIYRTTARQFFHADDCDIVGLLCVAKSLEGGESDIVSDHHVFNTLQRERPDVVETLTQPIWYFDRKGEVSAGQEPYTRQPVFYKETGKDGRLYTKWDPYYVKSLKRFSDTGAIPPLSEKQQEAAQVLEDTCLRLSLHMVLDIGDIQFLSNVWSPARQQALRYKLTPLDRLTCFTAARRTRTIQHLTRGGT